MKGPAVTLTNGHYEFRIPTGGRLVLADPPEAGWRRERSRRSVPRVQRERVRKPHARPNRLSPRLTPDPAVPFGRITGLDEKHSRQQQTRIRRTE